MDEAVIVSTARTPIGRAMRGAFNLTHGAVMGGHVVGEAVRRAGVEPAEVEEVVLGCANPEGATGGNIARQAGLRAGGAGVGGGDDGEPVLLVRSAGDRHRGEPGGVRWRESGGGRGSREHQPGADHLEPEPLQGRVAGRAHGRVHADDRDGGHRGGPLRHRPGAAERVCAGEPAAVCGRAAGRAVRRGDRAAAGDQGRRREGLGRGAARGGVAAAGRGEPAGDDAGGVGQAQAPCAARTRSSLRAMRAS